LNTDWWNYGGITRDVLLVEVPESFIRDYSIQLAKGTQGEVAGWRQLDGSSHAQTLTLEIAEAGVRKTLSADANGRVEFRFPAKLDLWSPENPKLYDVVISAGADTVHDSIGFRSVEVKALRSCSTGSQSCFAVSRCTKKRPSRRRAFSPEERKLCSVGRRNWDATLCG